MLPYWTVAQSLSMVMLAFSLYEFLIWVRARARRAHAALALLFALMGLCEICISRVYATESPESVAVRLKLLTAADCMTAFAFLWFLSEYVGAVGRKALARFGAAFAAIAAMKIAAPGDLGRVASLAAMLIGLVYIAYCLAAMARIAADGRVRDARLFGCVCFSVFLAIVNDSAVGMGLYRFIFSIEYAPAVSLFLIMYRTSSDVVDGAEAKERLRDSDLALKESRARWAALIENVPFNMWMCDKEGRLVMQNAADVAAVGDHVGRLYGEWGAPSETIRRFRDNNHRALKGEVVDDLLFFDVGGERRYYHEIISPATLDGKVIGSVGIGIDETGRKLAESRVQVLSRVVEQGPAIVVITDTAGSIEYVNPCFEASTGYSAAEALGKNPRMLKSGHTGEAEYRELWDAIGAGREWHGELLNKRKDGALYWEAASISPIVDEGGRITHYVAVMQDISAAKEQEKRLKAGLAEKEVLLREVHHRVKNNLQVVSSLLSINGSGVGDASAKEAFTASQRQVRAISLAHEALYLSESVAEVDLPAYLKSIAREISRSGDRPDVRIVVDAESVTLGIDRAVPCGLLVNELVTNALKHAFPEGRAGKVDVGLKRIGDGIARLTVEDDGVGFREGLSPDTSATMGMRLAASLAAQLGGDLSLGDGGRARLTIEFPT